MADIGKKGYQFTGYTEPFITTIPVSSGTALTVPDYDGFGAGIVAIEKSSFKNAGLFLRVETGVTAGVSFTANFINFDYRMDQTFLGIGKFVVSDGVDVAAVVKVKYEEDTELYTITVDSNLTVVAGQGVPVVGRYPDVAAITASKNYDAGERIVEPYPPEV